VEISVGNGRFAAVKEVHNLERLVEEVPDQYFRWVNALFVQHGAEACKIPTVAEGKDH